MKKYRVIFLTMAISIIMCGCGDEIPDMTKEQTAVVTEYATNLLVKYSTVSERALLNDKELEEGIAKEAEERERLLKVKELEKMYLNGTVKEDKDIAASENLDEDAFAESSPVAQLSLSEFFAEDSFSMEYSSYVLCQSYPEESGENEIFMAMDATPGKKLCIVKFNVTNVSSSDQTLDMYTKQPRFSLKLEDGSVIPAQSTLLMDDLSSYSGTVSAGGMEELVLVFEVPDSVSEIGAMQLVMRDQSGENTLTLQ